MTYPHLVLVGASPDIVGKMTGVPVTFSLVSRPGKAGTDAFERSIANRIFYTDITDRDALLSCVREIHGWRRVDAMLAATEHALLPTAQVAEVLGVRSNPVSAISRAQDKAAMRECLAEHGLTVIPHRLCETAAEAEDFLREYPAGIILKPRDGNGGRGIYLVRDVADLADAWRHTSQESAGRAVLAERFFEGIETSAETMSAAGRHMVLAVPRKHFTDPPHLLELAHEIPGDHDEALVARVADAAVAALTAIGHQWGPTNTEVKVDGEQVAVIEINPRFGGAQYVEMLELATGVDETRAAAMALCYDELPQARAAGPGHAVRMLIPSQGRVIAVTGGAEASALDGVIRVGDLPPIGMIVPPLADYRCRTGYVLTNGPSPRAARDIATAAARLVRIKTVPLDRAGKGDLVHDVRAALAAGRAEARADLESLVRIPSVSADPAHTADMRAIAERIAKLCGEAGARQVDLLESSLDGPPAIFAEFPGPPDMPMMLLYAHYDVQPAGDKAAWTADPFDPVERGGRLYGRGVADNKAAIAAHLATMRLFEGRPPIGVKLFIEGEEEVCSPGLASLLTAHRDRLAADVVMLADGQHAVSVLGIDVPSMPAVLTPPPDVAAAVRAAYGAAYRTDLRLTGSGGSLPFAAGFGAAFPAAALLITSAGADSESRIHAVDESLSLSDFDDACVAEAMLLIEIAKQHDKAPPPVTI